jgi:DNA-binding response OmpR family regulator
MPACSGIDAVDVLRKFYGDVPVLLVSAFPDAETQARAQALGAVLIDKPFSLRIFRNVVAGLLRARAQSTRPRS